MGGLLWESSGQGTYYTSYDGNGNIVNLIDAQTEKRSAHYKNDLFGKVLKPKGRMFLNNPFRFSTKYQDDESEVLYYGHHFYGPNAGRWLNREPAGS